MNRKPATILLAGGGSGGHIFPNLAVIEQLRALDLPVHPHLAISDRPLDREIARTARIDFTELPAQPLSPRPHRLARFLIGYRRSLRLLSQLIARQRPAALIATGGFVGGPAIAAARRASLPSALVNLDATPGRANRLMARRADKLFTAYPHARMPHAQHIGMPLRRSVVAAASPQHARAHFGLDPDTPTLLITAGSQGARSINQAMIALCQHPAAQQALAGWQILHLSGNTLGEKLQATYAQHAIQARVLDFCNEMGLAWAAARLAISRAGAGGVAEAWANHVPTLFLPYPYHRDQHQRHNAQPMVSTGGALLLDDRIAGQANAEQLQAHLLPLLNDPARLDAMRAHLAEQTPPDGAAAVAQWVCRMAGLDAPEQAQPQPASAAR